MKHSLLIVTLLFIFVRGDEWGLIHFSKTQKSLYKCLKDNFLWHKTGFNVSSATKAALADSIAYFFWSSTKTIETINDVVTVGIEDLVNDGDIDIDGNETLRLKFERAVMKIVLDCSDARTGLKNSSEKLLNYYELPHFLGRVEFERLVDLILVNWESLPEKLLSTRSRRSLLRRYARKALDALEKLYDKCFCFYDCNLRAHWYIRAVNFFDGRDQVLPYVSHVFSMDHEAPYTRDNPNLFNRRKTQSFRIRDPPATQHQIERVMTILEIYQNDSVDNMLRFYTTQGLTSSEYYFEMHLNRFYQILFLYLEMEERGIDDDHDVWDGPIPYNVLPEPIQAIVFNHTVYHGYILRAVQNNFGNNSVRKIPCHSKSARFREAYMILERSSRIKEGKGKIANSTISTTTTIESTTPMHVRKSKRGKGLIMKGDSGKWFPMKEDTSRNDDDDDEGPSKQKKFKHSDQYHQSMPTDDEYYGYFEDFTFITPKQLDVTFFVPEKPTWKQIIDTISDVFIHGKIIHSGIRRR